MKGIKVNITDIEILKIDKLRKIKKNGLDTSLIEDILKIHTTLLESFFGKTKIKYTIIESKEEELL